MNEKTLSQLSIKEGICIYMKSSIVSSMSQKFVEIDPEVEVSYNLKTMTTSNSWTDSRSIMTSNSWTDSATVVIPSNPIVLMDDRVRVLGEFISIGRYYPFEFKGKKYLLHRTRKTTTDIYQIKE